MKQFIAYITLVVEDYDDAIRFYTQKMDFKLIEDTRLSEAKRWVVVSPPNAIGCNLLLAEAANNQQKEYIGNQTGGRVFLFLHTDSFWRDYRNMRERGIHFIRKPKEESYGTVAVFADLYGNLWDLVQSS